MPWEWRSANKSNHFWYKLVCVVAPKSNCTSKIAEQIQFEATPAARDTLSLAENLKNKFDWKLDGGDSSESLWRHFITHWIQDDVRLPNIAHTLNVKKHTTSTYNESGIGKLSSDRLMSTMKRCNVNFRCQKMTNYEQTWLNCWEQRERDEKYEENVEQLGKCTFEYGPIWWSICCRARFSRLFHLFLIHQLVISIKSLSIQKAEQNSCQMDFRLHFGNFWRR